MISSQHLLQHSSFLVSTSARRAPLQPIRGRSCTCLTNQKPGISVVTPGHIWPKRLWRGRGGGGSSVTCALCRRPAGTETNQRPDFRSRDQVATNQEPPVTDGAGEGKQRASSSPLCSRLISPHTRVRSENRTSCQLSTHAARENRIQCIIIWVNVESVDAFQLQH